jgi:hypothetical protein
VGLEEDTAALRGLDNKLKEAMGPHTEAVLSNGVRYTYKAQHRDGYTAEPADFRVLRRLVPK